MKLAIIDEFPIKETKGQSTLPPFPDFGRNRINTCSISSTFSDLPTALKSCFFKESLMEKKVKRLSTIAKLSKGKTRKVESARGSPKLSAEVYQITQFPVCCKLRTKKLQKIRQKPEAVVIRKMLLLLQPRVFIVGLLLSTI